MEKGCKIFTTDEDKSSCLYLHLLVHLYIDGFYFVQLISQPDQCVLLMNHDKQIYMPVLLLLSPHFKRHYKIRCCWPAFHGCPSPEASWRAPFPVSWTPGQPIHSPHPGNRQKSSVIKQILCTYMFQTLHDLSELTLLLQLSPGLIVHLVQPLTGLFVRVPLHRHVSLCYLHQQANWNESWIGSVSSALNSFEAVYL